MIPLMWTFSTRTRWVIWDRGCLSDWVWTLPSGTWNWPMISRFWTIPLRHSVRTIWRQDAAWRRWRSVLAPSSSITPSTIPKKKPTALTCALRPGPRSLWVPWTASEFLPEPSETRSTDTRSRLCFWPSCVGREVRVRQNIWGTYRGKRLQARQAPTSDQLYWPWRHRLAG